MISLSIKQAGEYTMIFGRVCSFVIALAALLCVDTAILATYLMGYIKQREEDNLFVTPSVFKRIITNARHQENNMLIGGASIFSTGCIVGLAYYFNAPAVGLGLAGGCAVAIGITLIGAGVSTTGYRLAQYYGLNPTVAQPVEFSEQVLDQEMVVTATLPVVIAASFPLIMSSLPAIPSLTSNHSLPMATVMPTLLDHSSPYVEIAAQPNDDNNNDDQETNRYNINV